MKDTLRQSSESIIIEALGQTWFFTPDVVRILSITGVDPQDAMKTIILDHGSKRGIKNGVYEIETFGIELRITVSDNSVIVDDPYAW